MSKHKGRVRDVVALGPEPAVALIVEPADALLVANLLERYSKRAYSDWTLRGYALKPVEAYSLARKIKSAIGQSR